MIIGIGTDLFEVERMKKAISKQANFVDGIFTPKEIKYCNQFKNSSERFAARYAAKEALLKALGTGWRDGIKFIDIEITNDHLGKPQLMLSGKAKEIADRLSVNNIQVSMSHTNKLANAFVIISKI